MTSTSRNNEAIPPSINHLIGQKHIVRKIKIAIDSSFEDGLSFPHLLISSGPGLGKTTLAKIIGKEMASEFIETTGQSITSVSMLNGLLLSPVNPKFILFVDECHCLPIEVQTALLKILEEGCMFLVNDQRHTVQKIDLQPFTLILASTDVQKILSPLRDRMKLVCQLRRYSTEDIQLILSQKIAQYGWEADDGVLHEVAKRSFGTPRLAIRLLESIRRTARSIGESKLSGAHASETFCIEEIDDVGLGPDERMYLSILNSSTNPMRLGAIASRMGQQPLALSQVVEKNLLALQLICRCHNGRSLSAKGIEHVRGTEVLSAQNHEGSEQ